MDLNSGRNHMLPCFARFYIFDCVFPNTKNSSKRNRSSWIRFYLSNLLFCEFVLWMLFSVPVSPFLGAITVIISACSEKEMTFKRIGISLYTSRIVTLMEHAHSSRYWSYKNFPNETVGSHLIYNTVSPTGGSSTPKPASRIRLWHYIAFYFLKLVSIFALYPPRISLCSDGLRTTVREMVRKHLLRCGWVYLNKQTFFIFSPDSLRHLLFRLFFIPRSTLALGTYPDVSLARNPLVATTLTS